MPVSENLIANESIVTETKKHWIAPVRDSLMGGGHDPPGALPLVLEPVAATASWASCGQPSPSPAGCC